jgi:hypothetical protein
VYGTLGKKKRAIFRAYRAGQFFEFSREAREYVPGLLESKIFFRIRSFKSVTCIGFYHTTQDHSFSPEFVSSQEQNKWDGGHSLLVRRKYFYRGRLNDPPSEDSEKLLVAKAQKRIKVREEVDKIPAAKRNINHCRRH